MWPTQDASDAGKRQQARTNTVHVYMLAPEVSLRNEPEPARLSCSDCSSVGLSKVDLYWGCGQLGCDHHSMQVACLLQQETFGLKTVWARPEAVTVRCLQLELFVVGTVGMAWRL